MSVLGLFISNDRPIFAGTVLFSGSWDMAVKARNATTGEPLWSTQCEDSVVCHLNEFPLCLTLFQCKIVFYDGCVLAGVWGSNALALDANTGACEG